MRQRGQENEPTTRGHITQPEIQRANEEREDRLNERKRRCQRKCRSEQRLDEMLPASTPEYSCSADASTDATCPGRPWKPSPDARGSRTCARSSPCPTLRVAQSAVLRHAPGSGHSADAQIRTRCCLPFGRPFGAGGDSASKSPSVRQDPRPGALRNHPIDGRLGP